MEIAQIEDFTVELYEVIEVGNNKSGIYCIYNIVSGKHYVGSAVKLHNRISNHTWGLRKSKHMNRHLQSPWNKYREEKIILIVVEYCAIKSLNAREQFWLEQFDFEAQLYNICPTAGSHLGRKCSDETKNKLSESMKGKIFSEEHKRKLSDSGKGRTFSLETRRKIGDASKNRRSSDILRTIAKSNKGRKHTEETKRKISESHKNKSCTEETRKKLSDINIGKKHSEETKKKISDSNKIRHANILRKK